MSGKIVKADGSTPYDPNQPKDAKVATGRPQAIFYVQSPDGATAMRAPLNDSKTLTFQPPGGPQTIDVASEKGAAMLVVNVTFSGAAGPLPAVGNATVTLKDAGGNVTKTQAVSFQPNQPANASIVLMGKDITGAYKLVVDGTGAFSAKVDTLVAYDDHPFLVVTWDNPQLS